MRKLIYNEYQDYNPKIVLCEGIEDINPYHIILPDAPKAEQIINFGLPAKDQYFKPIVAPKELWALEGLVKSEKDKSEAFKALASKPLLADFVAKLHDTFEEGQWQYIRGVPIYVPGNYLKYCSFNRILNFLPEFRNWDIDKFYWWNECVVKSPVVYGGIEMTRRQVGKTYVGTFLAHEAAVTHQSGNVGIQSKTEDDADQAFKRGFLQPRKYYPFYLRPNSSTDLNTKGSKVEYDYPDQNSRQALDSTISYKSSGAHAYDGNNLLFYLNDECGKNTEEDVSYLLSVIRPLLHKDEQIRGKCLFTSTVEEMTKRGGQNFKNLWVDSDMQIYQDKSKQKIDENGQTVSGLIPYFTPAQNNYLKDQYGYAIVNDPLDYQYEYLLEKYKKTWSKNPEKQAKKGGLQLINERIERQKTDSKQQEEIRKFPRNIKEAFRSSAIGCLFDAGKINARLDYFFQNRGNDHLVSHGKLQWKDGIRFGDVEFVQTSKEEARMQVSLFPQQFENKSTQGYGGRTPANTHWFTVGADCFQNSIVLDYGKASKGSAHVYAGFNETFDNPLEDSSKWVTDDFVLEYFYRHEGMLHEEYAEDILMICIWYGAKCAPESNLRVIQDHFHKWGMSNYLMFGERLKLKDGILQTETSAIAGLYTGGEESKSPMVNAISQYVRDKCHRCKFPRTLEQFKELEYDNFTEYDLFISAAKAYQYHNIVADRQKAPEAPTIDYFDLLPTYRH